MIKSACSADHLRRRVHTRRPPPFRPPRDEPVAATSGPLPGRGLRVAGGLFSIAAGIVVLFWPGISLVLLLTILGAWLLFYGVVLAALAFRMRRELRLA
jgi:hypothetical protein